ncbi:SLIT and NTRK-like protein 5 [Callorhinchus milii]|uniref:SLIT and NTRK-like protein 5 n=1 Tax=Callorhinchus milii TaxID=7868 RepID=UPI001C3F53F2|nr:SLIT and NTRK-like protein 5 [Callorhinchus milii]
MYVWVTQTVAFASFALVWAESIDSYGDVCESLCSCEDRDEVLIVGCENREIASLVQISPPHFPVYHLFLTGNLLSRLYPNELLNFTGVSILHLGNNRIQEIEAGAFHGLRGLRRLHLNNNKLEGVRDDTFAGLENLEYLQVDYNYISWIEAGTFSKLHMLQVLILNDNLLGSLSSNVFRYVPLTHLDLRGNRLKMLPYAGLLEHMDRVVELQLEENPWNCSCDLIALKAWLESIAYTALVGEVVCETPFRLHGRDLDEVSKQELCPRRTSTDSDWKPMPPLTTHGYFYTTPAPATSIITFSPKSPARAPKSTRLPKRPISRGPTAKEGYNYGPIIAYQTKSPVPLVCPRQCTCNLQISDLGLNVNCQEKKIERVTELEPKPYNPKKMYLTGNHIQIVRRSDFIDSTGLDLLHLGHNKIATIQDRAFVNLTNLRRLYLNGNCIDRLTSEIFYGLRNLQYLYLEYNAIKDIALGTFKVVPNLQLLFLNSNLLRSFPADVFSGLNLTRINLRNNRFTSLPVVGVLEHLKFLIQIDLYENPWDCRCNIVGMKHWLEKLNTGAVINDVICQSPKKFTGEDVRAIASDLICPDYSDIVVTTPSPTAVPTPEPTSSSTTPPPLQVRAETSSVPLSVLILSLLLVFITSVFVAAGLFVVVMKRRKKAQSDRTSTNNSDVSSFNLHYGVYSHRSTPKAKSPASHVYEFIPHPLGHMCKNPIYRSREGNSVDDYRDLHELKVTYRNHIDEERENQLRSPTYSISTIEPREDISPMQEVEHFYRGILEPENESPNGNNIDYNYGSPPSYHYSPNYEVRRQYLHPERLREPVLYGAPSNVYIEQSRNDYLELKAKLHAEPDYLEVLEKQTTCSQF